MNGGDDARRGPGAGAAWPVWARRLATVALLGHGAAILSGIWAAPPASDLERAVAEVFEPYNGFVRQGLSYRYYSPEPPPTPVVTATIAFRDGRADETVRIPDRAARPRLLYQRQLALAHHLTEDVNEARVHGADPAESRWARAVAAHLGRVHPGAASVTLRSQLHLVPPIDRVRRELRERGPGSPSIDLDADEFFTTPERIGVFPCDAS